MRRPFWRKQTKHWYVKLHGKAVRLTEEPCPKTKMPPPHVEQAWHALTQKGEPKELTVREAFDRYRELKREDPKDAARWAVTKFEKYIGHEFKLSKLRPHHLTDFFRANPQWAPASVRTITNRILAAINHAVSEGLLDSNPVTSTPGYKRHGYYVKRKGVITPELRDRLEAAARPAFRAFLIALRESGARPVEIRRARIERCFLERGVMFVPNKTARKTGKPERQIVLSEELKKLLIQLIGKRTEGFIFLTQTGKPWGYSNVQQRWSVLTEKVPVPEGVTLYSYRRSWVSTAINEKNINPALVAQLAGHSMDILLKHYLQENPEALKKAVEAITSGPRP